MEVDARSFAEAFARPYQGERSTYGGQQWKSGSLLIGVTGAPAATDALPCDDPSGTKMPFDATSVSGRVTGSTHTARPGCSRVD